MSRRMMKYEMALAAGALGLAVAVTIATPNTSQAAPTIDGAAAVKAITSSQIDDVVYRGAGGRGHYGHGRYGHGYYGRGYGRGYYGRGYYGRGYYGRGYGGYYGGYYPYGYPYSYGYSYPYFGWGW